MIIMMITVITLRIILIFISIIITIIMFIPIIIIRITIISYSDVLGPLRAPRLLNQGSMLLGPRPLMFLLARRTLRLCDIPCRLGALVGFALAGGA